MSGAAAGTPMLGPTQIDRFGQSNTSALGGTYERPKVMMLGARGFPGNSISHPNSFFVPGHNTRVFLEGECDFVSSIGYNPARLPKGHSLDDIDIRLVVTDLCVMDFAGPRHQMRLVSLHPGVSVDQVQENTGFPVHIDGEVPTTAAPTREQLDIIAALDPHNQRAAQIADNPPGVRSPGGTILRRPRLTMLDTRLTELLGCRYPIVQTAMGWVADPRLVAGSCNAGGFGFLAGATIPADEIERDILRVKELTDRPFGVNFHMYQPNAADIVDLVIKHGVRAVSYSRSPGRT
ncbi:MAG: nitronate monooxygenase [Halioglobus sp.]|nr:nitronate monooxygenase [Halioglobus sp.]